MPYPNMSIFNAEKKGISSSTSTIVFIPIFKREFTSTHEKLYLIPATYTTRDGTLPSLDGRIPLLVLFWFITIINL
jgi:hypothetical protein